MWVVWTVSAVLAGLGVYCVLLLREDWDSAQRGWKLLASSGVPLALLGFGFILRFWEPESGPFRANELYPLGPYLNAWAVSFGFMWVAFGLAFFALALRASPTGRTWFLLLVTWAIAWIPHGIIGIGFAMAGENSESLELYRDWASRWPGLFALGASALVLVGHFVLSLLGFANTGRSLLRQRAKGVST